jgi:hypothetical protein
MLNDALRPRKKASVVMRLSTGHVCNSSIIYMIKKLYRAIMQDVQIMQTDLVEHAYLKRLIVVLLDIPEPLTINHR